MRWRDNLRIALGGITANMLRSALTVLGVLIGVAAVVILVAVGTGSSKAVAAQINRLGTNTLTVFGTGRFGGRSTTGTQSQTSALTIADVRLLEDKNNAPDVLSVSPVSSTSVTATYSGATTTATVTGSTPSYLTAEDYTVEAGSPITDTDVTKRNRVILIGQTIASDLFTTGQNPLGQTIQRPADKAGIVAGDVITAFDGKDISEMRFLPRMVAETKIGKTVSVTFWHKNASKSAQLTVGELDESKDDAASDKDNDKKPKETTPGSETVLGMEVSPLNPALREELQLDDKVNGLAVVDVVRGSEAEKRGIDTGDVIVDVNGIPTKTADDLKKAFDDAKKQGRKFALVRVNREKEDALVTLPTSEEKKEEKKE